MTTASSPSTGVQTYRGSCQCGAVRFEADFNPNAGTTRCNCTICNKTAWWGVHVKPEAFRLVAGQEVLRDFSRHEAMHARFCGVCGIRVFGHGDIPELGGAFYAVNLNCLDGAELSGVPVRYLDGLHDTWAELAVAPYVSPFSPAAHARA
ncbi:GFA family protein [Cystobacter ferrugineus]|uniref:Aldehyde-activating protein n=1 Tax=Cystobacter ferrugineus TaxID=83449 RepID=A0A1L9AU31_9BACT|nr:GFA family protein [Cystobacter ferrugineus]OJH33525.1 aldehyde-activating protein [Cystobacter ferrugineus]